MKYLINVLIISFVSVIILHSDENAMNNEAAQGQTLADIKLQAILDAQNALLTQLESKPDAYSDIEKERRFYDIFKEYDDFISNNPSYIHADILYGKLLRKTGLTQKAHGVFLAANKKNPHLAVIKQQLGNYLAEEGQYALALPFFVEAINLEPSEAIYHYQLGELLHRFKNSFLDARILTEEKFDHQMLNAFCKAKELDPGSWIYQVRYAEAFFDLSKTCWDEALKLWQILEVQAPDTREKEIVYLNQARIQLKRKNYKSAKDILAKIYSPEFEKSRRELLELIPVDS